MLCRADIHWRVSEAVVQQNFKLWISIKTHRLSLWSCAWRKSYHYPDDYRLLSEEYYKSVQQSQLPLFATVRQGGSLIGDCLQSTKQDLIVRTKYKKRQKVEAKTPEAILTKVSTLDSDMSHASAYFHFLATI